jgi:hypothetical protein
MAMNDLNTNHDANTATPEIHWPEACMAGEFDAARVFADPVAYLERLGIRSELADTQRRDFPAAA